MALSSKDRRELLRASHELRPVVTVSAAALSDAAVAQVRQAFGTRELLKIRVQAETGAECDAAAAEVAARVPCELVKRVGRAAVLYRSSDRDGSGDRSESGGAA